MKKFSKIGKRVLAFFLVALMNINTYATSASNDGSMFITKADFDTLVNNFNERMNDYQSGLNAKIDDAIAGYIGGLSGVKVVNMSPLYIPSHGVWSATTGDDKKNWTEGTMSARFTIYMGRILRNSNKTGGYVANFNPLNATYFKEHLISGVSNTSNGTYAKYDGYAKTKQYCVGYGGDIQQSDFNYTSSVYINTFYWRVGSTPRGAYQSDTTTTGTYNNVSLTGGACSRTVDETLLDCVICTPKDGLEFPYFNHSNTAGNDALWCNDDNVDSNNLHTSVTRPFDCFASVTGTLYTPNSGGGTFYNGTAGKQGWKSQDNRLQGDSLIQTKPFLGFSKDTKDWKFIYLNFYDDIIEDLVTKSNASFTTVNGKKKFLITNGFPLVKLNMGDKVKLPVKFDKVNDEWKNIDIWLKASAFKLDEDVRTTQDQDIIKMENVSNMVPSVFSNAITLDASKGDGEGILSFTMPRDGYVFMKWSLAGNDASGGGTFYPKQMKVELAQ